MAKLNRRSAGRKFEKLNTAFNKNKSRFNIPGFRKGKAPQAMIEKMYGAEVFYEDATNEVIDASIRRCRKESKLDVVSQT